MAKDIQATHDSIENDGKESARLSPTAEQLLEHTNTRSLYRSAVNLAGKENYQYLPTSSEFWCKTIMEIYETMYRKVTDMTEIVAILSFRSAVMAPSTNEDERPRADTKSSIKQLISLGYTLQNKLYWDIKSAELVDRAHSKAVFESCYGSWFQERVSSDNKSDNTSRDINEGIMKEDTLGGEASKDAEASNWSKASFDAEARMEPETFLRRKLPTDFYEYVAKTVWSAILRDGAAQEEKENDDSSPFEDWL